MAADRFQGASMLLVFHTYEINVETIWSKFLALKHLVNSLDANKFLQLTFPIFGGIMTDMVIKWV